MRRGRLGLPRPLGLGPLTPGGILFGQPETAEQMGSEIEDIVQDMGISIDTEEDDEIEEVTEELSKRVFPDSERKQERFVNCISSEWGGDWSDGLLDVSGASDSTPLEQVSMAGAGCRGMVEANTLEVEQ